MIVFSLVVDHRKPNCASAPIAWAEDNIEGSNVDFKLKCHTGFFSEIDDLCIENFDCLGRAVLCVKSSSGEFYLQISFDIQLKSLKTLIVKSWLEVILKSDPTRRAHSTTGGTWVHFRIPQA